MLANIVRWSVERRYVVLFTWLALFAVCLSMLRKLSVDAVPDVTNVQVSVLTSAPGLSPVEVEQYLTYPIETAMNGMPGVTEIRSVSRTAVSAVTIVFSDSTDIWFARQLVAERLKQAEAEIPEGYGRPELSPVSTGLGEIYEFYLASNRHSPMELRTLLDWEVGYALRGVPGVIEVNAMGGEAKQYQVIVDPRKLSAYKLTLARIEEALRSNNQAIGAGYIEKNSEAYVIRGEAQLRTQQDIESVAVANDTDGTPVLLKQVAQVRVGAALRFGSVTKLGQGEIVAGTVMMLMGGNSRNVVAGVKAKLQEVQKKLPEGVEIHSYYDRAEFIERMLSTVAINLGEGALLVVLVLFLTLGTLRGSLLAALGIPLAMGVAILGMVQLKVTGNLMSLGAIDFGLLVDGAIVMLETALSVMVARKVREKKDVIAAVADSMSEAARPVAFSLAIILLVYLPLMALEGVEGRMFKPMAVTVALALFGALLFSLTAFPALCAVVLSAPSAKPSLVDRTWARLIARYEKALSLAMRHAGATLGVAIAALLFSVGLATTLGAEFLPRLEEGELSLDVKRLPSVSITEAQRLGVQVEQVLSEFPEVLSVVTRTGRAEVATDPVGPDETEVMVKLKDKREWTTARELDALGEAIKNRVEERVPATFVGVSQPIEDRVNQLLSGSRADVVVKVFGEDLATMKATADQIGAVMKDIPGRGDFRVQRVLGLPLLNIKPDRNRLARYNVAAADVLAVVEASRVGREVGKIFEGKRRFDLKLFSPPAELTPTGFGDLRVGTPAGQIIPLASVADIKETEGPAVINREALERRVLVEVNVRGRDLVSYVKEAQEKVSQIPLPPGIHLEWGGQFDNFARAKDRLSMVAPIALVIIFVMLFMMFQDVRYAAAVFAGAPFAVIGGVISLVIRDLPFSIPAAVGFIAVAGVSVLNGVVMASHVRHGGSHSHAEHHGDDFLHRVSGVFRPVVTTALVACIGFVPMALSTRAGAEVQRPLATVVIGGLLSSTVLSLFVLPILIQRLTQKKPNH